MKIKDILKEDENELDVTLLQKIIDSRFFKLNWKPIIDQLRNEQNKTSYVVLPDKDTLPALYHGGKLLHNEVNMIKYRNTTLDTPKLIHNTINQLSEKKFGVPIRNMMFSTKVESRSAEYGKTFLVIPLEEDYQFYYSDRVDDLYTSPLLFNQFRYNDTLSDIFEIAFKKINYKYSMKFINFITDNIDQSGILYNAFKLRNLKSFDEISEYLNKESIKSVEDELKFLLSNNEEIDNDPPDIDFFNLAKIMLQELVNHRKKWIMENAKQYVDSIESTQYLNDIAPDYTEVLLPEGKYAVFAIVSGGLDTKVFYKIVNYYINSLGVKNEN